MYITLRFVGDGTDSYCCFMHCIWMELQVACHSHLHIRHLKGLSQGMIHLLMLSVPAVHEMRLTVCMWLCTGRKWFTSFRLFSISKCLYCIKSQSRLHEQVWWRNEFCKGSLGEWYTGKFVQSKTIVLHRYNLMCVLYTRWTPFNPVMMENCLASFGGRRSAVWTQKIQWCAWRICLGCRMPESPPRVVGLYALGLDVCLYRGKLKWNEA
jgi:hypothetical protein